MKQDQKTAKDDGEELTDRCFICEEKFYLDGWLNDDRLYRKMFYGMCDGAVTEKLDVDGGDVCPCCIVNYMPKNWKKDLGSDYYDSEGEDIP
jgi:hypothetical protein